MAADDIFRVQNNFEGPTSAASWSLYYREVSPQTGPGIGTQVVGEAFDTIFRTPILNCLANDWQYSSTVTRKMINNPAPMDRFDVPTQVGARAAPSLPANNALLFELSQATFAARSNGSLFLPGQSESDNTIGNWTAAYLNGPVTVLRDLILGTIDEVSGTGTWEPGVISVKVLDAAPPAKDWDGAFAPIVGVSYSPIVHSQRRRQTKVRGMQL